MKARLVLLGTVLAASAGGWLVASSTATSASPARLYMERGGDLRVARTSLGRAADWVPFDDLNDNGRFDPLSDALGHCAGAICAVPPLRVEIRRLRPPTGSRGVLVTAFDRTRPGSPWQDICTASGLCSSELELPFAEATSPKNALWLCARQPEQLPPELADLTVGAGVHLSIEPRPHQELTVEQHDERTLVRTSLDSDVVVAQLVREQDGRTIARPWTARASRELGATPGIVWRTSTALDVVPPLHVLDACRDCVLLVQAVHVWRDDWVHDVSEGRARVEPGARAR
jgi:hypothetical protein